MPDFLGIERLSLGPWQAFERTIQRYLLHLRFTDVRLVGGAGDQGADVVGERDGHVWVVQAKFRSTGQLVGADAIAEVTTAIDRYRADRAAVATNSGYTADAVDRARRISTDIGLAVQLWNGDHLLGAGRRIPLYASQRDDPRPYQSEAISAINERIMEGANSALLLMATGLGKTRVAAGVVEQWMHDRPTSQVLLLASSLPLVPQLEAALWPYLPKWIPTHQLTGAEKPAFEGGVTVATQMSMANRVDLDYGRFGLVIVDEAHHAPADGYRTLLKALEPAFLMGMTATPWRGDERQIEAIFGEATFAMSIVEGMQLGYLADVDYRMLIDDIDWDYVRTELPGSVSIRDLNRRLFVPERDDAIIAKILESLRAAENPRCVVFSRSIEHASRVSGLLRAQGWANRLMHSRLDRVEITRALHEFRSGQVPVIVTVDMLNEGIDIPDVNLIIFLRVTHSRRIFVQQLGRGLRLSPGKEKVTVLDFVSDVRRIAAAIELNREATESHVDLAGPIIQRVDGIVTFENDSALNFFDEYLADVAELDDESDDAVLRFPN